MNLHLFLFLGCRDRYWTSSWRSDQHTQNQRTFWEGHWKPATHVNQQTWQISWYSPGSEGLCASLEGWLWVFSAPWIFWILNQDYSTAVQSFLLQVILIFLSQLKPVWFCGTLTRIFYVKIWELHFLMGENKKKTLIPHFSIPWRKYKNYLRNICDMLLDCFSSVIKKKMRMR